MIAYRVELWCDGCTERFHVPLICLLTEIPISRQVLLRQAEQHGWIADGIANYCPRCQVQRKAS